jgi:uncharacterized protein YndB with AHSA1/START domain
MTTHNVQHGSFTIERVLDAPVSMVFKAWADKAAKARWFVGPNGWKAEIREQDFRVGGHDRLKGAHPNGMTSDFLAEYRDIVPDERIVYVYDMHINGNKISVSLATITFAAAAGGTRMTVTEQGAFLDGYDDSGNRERGTNTLMDQFAAALKQH